MASTTKQLKPVFKQPTARNIHLFTYDNMMMMKTHDYIIMIQFQKCTRLLSKGHEYYYHFSTTHHCPVTPPMTKTLPLCFCAPLRCTKSPPMIKWAVLRPILFFTIMRARRAKASSKGKSPLYWKPFVLWDVFIKPATFSPLRYAPFILIEGHKWVN